MAKELPSVERTIVGERHFHIDNGGITFRINRIVETYKDETFRDIELEIQGEYFSYPSVKSVLRFNGMLGPKELTEIGELFRTAAWSLSPENIRDRFDGMNFVCEDELCTLDMSPENLVDLFRKYHDMDNRNILCDVYARPISDEDSEEVRIRKGKDQGANFLWNGLNDYKILNVKGTGGFASVSLSPDDLAKMFKQVYDISNIVNVRVVLGGKRPAIVFNWVI